MKNTNFYFSRHDTIGEIKNSFSHYYPSMEINFFSNNKKNQPDNAWVMLSAEVRIRDISPESRNGCVELNDKMTITELENSIGAHFNLHVEISPCVAKPHFTFCQNRFMELKPKDAEWTRLPERTGITYFKNVPFGC
jgi:hypothetical protein